MVSLSSDARRACRLWFATCVSLLSVGLGPGQDARRPPGGMATSESRFEVLAVDKNGRPGDGLRPADVTVTIDGAPRPVVSLRRVSRGPGAAADAARRQAAGGPEVACVAEPARNILVVIDQTLILSGEEKPTVDAARAFVGRLGIVDRVAVVRLPLSTGQRIEFTSERRAAREAISQMRGQAALAGPRPADSVADALAIPVTANPPERVAGTDTAPKQGLPATIAIDETSDPALRNARGTLGAIAAMLRSMQAIPGRKVIAIFSPGVQATTVTEVDDASAAAVSARATVYTFAAPAVTSSLNQAADPAPLQALAKRTGGISTSLGKDPDKALDSVMDDLSLLYVVGVVPAAGDLDGKRHTLQLQSMRKDITLRGPAWLLPAVDSQDVVPEPVDSPVKDANLAIVLGRLFDYVDAYEANYSALVAEEEFTQSAGPNTVRLRSDFLLVKQESTGNWVSFRDVFEVDGKPVRDRDDRLKRLFLEPHPNAVSQLASIKSESARYNIGPFERDFNVPLFLLKYLTPANRSRFAFRIGGRMDAQGVEAMRLDFTERGRPTMIKGPHDKDISSAGYLIVDQRTGAIISTLLTLELPSYLARVAVQFKLDPDLGMWVPAAMNETYGISRTAVNPGISMSIVLSGNAKYTRFRRFQVTTEETGVIKK
jgi:VWFA-related protein